MTTPTYNWSTTGTEVVTSLSPQIHNKTIVITGPSPGSLGAETALTLAHSTPSTIILLGRSHSKTLPVLNSIHALNPLIKTHFIPIDLSSLTSVRHAAASILSNDSIPKIDVLINNAAIMACPYATTEDGFESQLGVNHLAHFLLTNLLMPKILAAGPDARIVAVSSWAHLMSPVLFSDPGFKHGEGYEPWVAYGQAKSAIVLFAVELNRRLALKGKGKVGKAWTLHPGSVKSGLQVHVDGGIGDEARRIWEGLGMELPVLKNLQQGVATGLRAGFDTGLGMGSGEEGLVYLQDCVLVGGKGFVADWAVDEENARRCWEMSEEMVGERFDW